MASYIVQRTAGPFGDTAWLVLPNFDPGLAYFDTDRSKATVFHFRIVARSYCRDETTTVISIDDTGKETPC